MKFDMVFESKTFFAKPNILIVAAPAVIDFWKRNKDYSYSMISCSTEAPVLTYAITGELYRVTVLNLPDPTPLG